MLCFVPVKQFIYVILMENNSLSFSVIQNILESYITSIKISFKAQNMPVCLW